MENSSAPQNSLDLLTPRLFDRLLGLLQQYRVPFCASMVTGLMCYMFAFTNKLINHDELNYMFTSGASLISGRWGIDILSLIFPDCSIPWFYGMITITLISLSSCLMIRLLEIRKPLVQALAAALVICFPSLIGTFGYMFTSAHYGVAFLFAVLAAWCLDQGKWYWSLGGLGCCIFSLSIYQAYIAITAGLLVLILIRRTMYTDTPIKNLLIQGIYFVAALALSMGLYWVLTQLLQRLAGIPMDPYGQRAFSDGQSLFSKLTDCIRVLIYVLLLGYKGLIHEGFLTAVHLVCGGILGLEVLFWCIHCRKADRILMLLFLLTVFPFAMTAVVLLTSMTMIHSLVLYGIVGIYLLAAVLIDGGTEIHAGKAGTDRLRTIAFDLALLCMAATVYSNCSTANRAYLNLHMRYENNYSMGTSLMTQIESTEGFTADTPVALIGYFPVTVDYEIGRAHV